MTNSNHSIGHLGYGIVGGMPADAQMFFNYAHGCFIEKGTTGPAQVTGTGNGTFYYDITTGVVVVDGTPLDVTKAADTLLETAGNILANGQSVVYTIIAWKNVASGAVAIKVVKGTVATTGSQVAPTVAQIEATLPDGAIWVYLGSTTINRTGDETATQTGTTNKGRPTLVPYTVNRN